MRRNAPTAYSIVAGAFLIRIQVRSVRFLRHGVQTMCHLRLNWCKALFDVPLDSYGAYTHICQFDNQMQEAIQGWE